MAINRNHTPELATLSDTSQKLKIQDFTDNGGFRTTNSTEPQHHSTADPAKRRRERSTERLQVLVLLLEEQL